MQPQPAAPAGLLQRPMGFLGNNSNFLLSLGAGLLDRGENVDANPLGQVVKTAMVGKALDAEGQQNKRALQEAQVQRTATMDFLIGKGLAASPEEAKQMVDAGIAKTILSEGLKPKEPLKWHSAGDGYLYNDMGEARRIGGYEEPPTDDMREYEWATQDPRRMAFLKRNTGTTINNNMPGAEKAFDTEAGKLFAGEYVDIQKGARQASSMLGRLDRMEQLLATPNLKTGAGASQLTDLRRAASSLGMEVDTESLGAAESVRAIANELALQLRNPAGGAGMPGALSDKDREFLVNMVPGLTKTPEGNRRMIDYMKRLQQRNVEIAELANEYVRQTGRLDAGFYDQLEAWSEQNPLFPEAERMSPGGISGRTRSGVPFTVRP